MRNGAISLVGLVVAEYAERAALTACLPWENNAERVDIAARVVWLPGDLLVWENTAWDPP